MYEHFIPLHNSDYVPSGDQLKALTHDANHTGGLLVEVHVDFCRYGNDMYPLRGIHMSSDSFDFPAAFGSIHGTFIPRSRYNHSLAAFLIGASSYNYYACTDEWRYTSGWNKWSDDYDRPRTRMRTLLS